MSKEWGIEEELWDRNWSELSGGEAQRIALATGVGLKNAEILLLDGKQDVTISWYRLDVHPSLTIPALYRTDIGVGRRHLRDSREIHHRQGQEHEWDVESCGVDNTFGGPSQTCWYPIPESDGGRNTRGGWCSGSIDFISVLSVLGTNTNVALRS